LLNDALAAASQARTWSFDATQGTMIIDDQANVVLDLPTIFNPELMRGQYIDPNGKLRFFLYDDMTITTPLLPPLNTEAVGANETLMVPLERVFEFVNQLREQGFDALVYALNTEVGGDVVGAWWYLGEPTPKTLFFIPTLPSTYKEEYKAIHVNYLPYPAIFSSGDSARNRYDHLARVKYVLFELLHYLFIFNLQLPEPMDVERFVRDYTTVIDGHEYRTEGIDRYFPQPNTLNEALDALVAKVPSFIQDGKVVLDSQLLRERLLSYLRVFSGQIEGKVPDLPYVMHNFYQAAADFTQSTGQVIFDSYARAMDWMQRLQQDPLTTVITNKITDEHTKLIDPYVLATEAGYFLVQNVLDGNYERALHVAQNWRTGVNLGYNAPALGSGPTVVYQVGETGMPEKPTGNGSDYLLRYPKDYFAAMLYLSR
jgi:hypothetical protein